MFRGILVGIGGALVEMISIEVALTVFGGAFAAWAGLVAWAVRVVRQEFSGMKDASEGTRKAFTEHVMQNERRLILLETEHGYIKDWFAEMRRK